MYPNRMHRQLHLIGFKQTQFGAYSCFVCQVVLECCKNYRKNFDPGNSSVTSIRQSVKSWHDLMCELNRSLVFGASPSLWGPLSSAGRLPLYFAPLVGESLAAALAASSSHIRGKSAQKHRTLVSNFWIKRTAWAKVLTSAFSVLVPPERIEWIWKKIGSKIQTERIRFSPAPGGRFDAHNEVTSDTVDDLHTVNPRVNAVCIHTSSYSDYACEMAYRKFPARIRNRIAIIIRLVTTPNSITLRPPDSMLFRYLISLPNNDYWFRRGIFLK